MVHSAAEALHALQDHNDIDAVLSDIRMPGITGLELADEIRRSYPAVRIILMSGYAPPQLLHVIDQPVQFIMKPYRIDALLDLLHG